MKNLFNKLKSYLFNPINVEGESFKTGVRTVLPSVKAEPVYNAVIQGDRVRYFRSYNSNLVNRISEIKSKNS